MNKKYHVEMTAEEQEQVIETLNAQAMPKTIRKRCHVLLSTDERTGKAVSYKEISARYGVSEVTVYNTVKDYCEKGLDYVMRRRTHAVPPNKPIITGEAEARIIALACGEAPEGYARWTVRLLAAKAVELQIVESVGRETIRTTLKKHNLNLT